MTRAPMGPAGSGDLEDARAQLEAILDNLRDWSRRTRGTAALGRIEARALRALGLLTDPRRGPYAASRLLMICWPSLDPDHPSRPPATWWSSPLGRACARALGPERLLRMARDLPRDEQTSLVLLAHALGASWSAIGRALGMSRQLAHYHWGPRRSAGAG